MELKFLFFCLLLVFSSFKYGYGSSKKGVALSPKLFLCDDFKALDGIYWCVAAEKTDFMYFKPEGVTYDVNVMIGGCVLELVHSKKILGVTIDDQLTFQDHIEKKKQSSLAALRAVDMLADTGNGCSQRTYMRLYKAIALPIMDYAAGVSAHESCEKEFSQVQKYAMTKASGCLKSTGSEMLEVLTNTLPIDVHLRLRQAQEVVRIACKYESDPLRQEFNEYLDGTRRRGKCSSTFDLLMARFAEFKGEMDFEHIEKEFEYSREVMFMSRSHGKVDTGELENTKDAQGQNILGILEQYKEEILVFTDGSALGNPGPTGAGAAVYMDGYQSEPILLKKAVSKWSNNYHGELIGINMALEFLIDLEEDKSRKIHIFTDGQGAIQSIFNPGVPATKVILTIETRQMVSELEEKVSSVAVHWVPGHIGIIGNELADKMAKEGANEALELNGDDVEMMDSKEVIKAMKNKAVEKWQLKFGMRGGSERAQDLFEKVGERECSCDTNRRDFSTLNQLMSGQNRLRAHMSKIDKNISPLCDVCNVIEDVQHYLLGCDKYKIQRKVMEERVELAVKDESEPVTNIDEAFLLGQGGVSSGARKIITDAVVEYIEQTSRFFQTRS